ncbi:Hypothetical protein CINCED_3A003357 [Cinara cedri]|uniref:Uncharacterized protein n=1 Tax=Cinara cedri TaxID=506608 RepID=A0A5E4M6R3_9HEMI|nr:Hypothetical protein CINCED_3A003357 [Cinara cedri]
MSVTHCKRAFTKTYQTLQRYSTTVRVLDYFAPLPSRKQTPLGQFDLRTHLVFILSRHLVQSLHNGFPKVKSDSLKKEQSVPVMLSKTFETVLYYEPMVIERSFAAVKNSMGG